MMGKGLTEGVFQFESDGMKNVLRQFGPENIEDLIAIISLYRPGPMDSIPKYIHNRHNPKDVTYDTPLLEPILRVTYGCIVYQEQVMQVFRSLAGYSLGRADIVRRAMAKKKHDVMQKEKDAFIYGEKDSRGNVLCEGAVNRGVSEAAAKKIFDDMSAFSSYAFNKSHAAAYAVVAYRTAYLKCHYPAQYFAALLTSVLDSAGKVAQYVAEARRMGLRVLPPSVNSSVHSFTAEKDGIRFGLSAIKNLGNTFITRLIAEREKDGNYTSLYDFCRRNFGRELNRRAMEGLIKSGAMDNLADNRRQMLYNLDTVLSVIEEEMRFGGDGQMGLFGEEDAVEPVLQKIEEMPREHFLAMEKEAIGIYLTGHPMDAYEAFISRGRYARVGDIRAKKHPDGARVSVVGIMGPLRVKQLKSGTVIAYSSIEDTTGQIEITAFSTVFNRYRELLEEGVTSIVHGKISEREDRDPELIPDKIEAVPEGAQNMKKQIRAGLYLKIPSVDSVQFAQIKTVLSAHTGKTPVYIVCADSGKRLEAPESLRISPNDELFAALSEIIGTDNVKYIT